MTAPGAPPLVRVETRCPHLVAYRLRFGSEHVRRGVVVPGGQPRHSLGARVHLEIALADGTLGYSGDAIVVADLGEDAEFGQLVRLDELARAPSPGPVAAPAGAVAVAPPAAPAGSPAGAVPPLALAAAPAPPAVAGRDGGAPPGAPGSPVDPAAPPGTAPGALPDAPADPPRRPNRTELLELLFGADPPRGEILDQLLGAPGSGVAPPALEAATAAPGVPPVPVALAAVDPDAPRWDPDDDTRRIAPLVHLDPPDPPASNPLPLPRPPSLAARLAAGRGRWALLAATVALVTPAALAAAAAGRRSSAREAALVAALAAADARLELGRLAAPAGDSAVDHLEAARRLAPADARQTSRGRALSDAFEALGARALARGDLREAAAHFGNALRADPSRASARARLETIARIAPLPPAARAGEEGSR